MDRDEFLQEIEGYSQEELLLIYETQQDVYTPEEMALILERIKPLPTKKKVGPLTVICCILSCIVPLFGIILGLILLNGKDAEKQKHGGDYLVCGCLPSVFVGLIVSIVLLCSKRDESKRLGRKCMITALISVLLGLFMWNGGFRI